jgi:hypothetical protein
MPLVVMLALRAVRYYLYDADHGEQDDDALVLA